MGIDLKAVLKKARKLDEDALAQLTNENYEGVYRFFYYRTQTKEDAEDLTHEVFIRMVRSIGTQTGVFSAWLFRIARNLLVDHYRKEGKNTVIALEEIDKALPALRTKDAQAPLKAEEIRSTLSVLTDEQREVIVRKFFEGYTNQEIAEDLGKTAGAVKLLQFRALGALRQVFQNLMR